METRRRGETGRDSASRMRRSLPPIDSLKAASAKARCRFAIFREGWLRYTPAAGITEVHSLGALPEYSEMGK